MHVKSINIIRHAKSYVELITKFMCKMLIMLETPYFLSSETSFGRILICPCTQKNIQNAYNQYLHSSNCIWCLGLPQRSRGEQNYRRYVFLILSKRDHMLSSVTLFAHVTAHVKYVFAWQNHPLQRRAFINFISYFCVLRLKICIVCRIINIPS